MQDLSNNFTADKYINEIAELYNLTDKERQKMEAGTEKIFEAFGDYYWTDVKDAIGWFYMHKSDKGRPSVAHILVVLNDHNAKKRVHEPEDTKNPFARPTTKIWAIQADFDKMIQIFIDGGVIPDENGRVHNIRSIIDPITDLPVLSPLSWFTWKLCAVRETRPDLFARFPHANTLEQLAIALGNKLIPFKVRDWSKLAADLRAKNGGKIPRSAINLSMGAM